MGRQKARRSRPAGVRGRHVLLVAVDGADLGLLPGAPVSFAAYWAEVDARARAAARTGQLVLLRPLVAFDYARFCDQHRLDPRSAAALAAYEALPVPEQELTEYLGDPPEVLLNVLRYEREAWATGLRSKAVLAAVVEEHGPVAERELRGEAGQMLDALLAGAQAGDELTLVAKAAGLSLGAHAGAVRLVGGRPALDDRDRGRLETLLAAALPTSATGVAALTSAPIGGATERVLVWELSPAGLVPSEHGELILAPDGPRSGPKAEYLPGFALTRR
ncbi:hypothetical protein [Kitasatospora purpeofusca]|uniref:hypothetical protein n=1 Tax=Kitasatospora purpeofusca TaxID=67352 RepID=UPI00368556B4